MSTASQFIAAFVVNSLWQIPLIAAVAAFCARLMRHAPSVYRHVVWVAALGLCVGLPLTSSWSSAGGAGGVNSVLSQASTADSEDAGRQTKLGLTRFSFSGRNHVRPLVFPPLLTGVLIGCYAGFLLYRTARIGWSLRGTLKFRDAGYSRDLSAPLSEIAKRCANAFALPEVAIICSPEALGPVTLSFPNPMLILPERFFREVSEADFSSALCHELAHIRRHDFLLNLLYEFVSTPVAFHPATAWIKERIAVTRELACDEAAVAKLLTRGTYARSLLNIARSLCHPWPEKPSSSALGLFDTNTLEERIVNLLGKRDHVGRKWLLALTVVAASLLTLTCMGISAFSLQVVQPAGTVADIQKFVGKWIAVQEGTPFIILELHLEKQQLAGGMRMASNFHIDTDGSGVAIQINDKTLLESLPARNFKVTGRSLTFDYKDYDGDETHWKLEVSGTDAAHLTWVELPEGMKAAPIPVTRRETGKPTGSP